jgi:hypothetical protein
MHEEGQKAATHLGDRGATADCARERTRRGLRMADRVLAVDAKPDQSHGRRSPAAGRKPISTGSHRQEDKGKKCSS